MDSEDVVRISVRLNQRVPEHAKIIGILEDLNKNYHTTKSGFIIEAISFYIQNISDEKLTNSGKRIADEKNKHLITEDHLEKRIDQYDQSLKRWLLDSFIPLLRGANVAPSPVFSQLSFPGEGEPAPKEVDLTAYPEIMKDIAAWSEDQ